METGAFHALIGPAAEVIEVPTTVALDAGQGLFGDVATDIVLIGTSFSARTEFNFAGFLQQATGMTVVNLAVEGQGPFAPMQAALDAGTITDLSPSIVIWEIPERYISPRSLP